MKFKITIPTSLSDIKLSQYQKFVRTTKGSEDEMFISRQMIGIFCNVSDEIVGSIQAKNFEEIINQISETLQQKPEFKSTFKLEGIEYGFIPNLEDITVDEKADLDMFYKELETMDNALSVLYRPIKVKTSRGYLIEDYKGDSKSLDATLDVVFGANVFFSSLMSDLLNYTQNFINDQVENNPKASQILEQNGVGTTAFINSLAETFLNLKQLVSYDYTMR